MRKIKNLSSLDDDDDDDDDDDALELAQNTTTPALSSEQFK